MLGGILLASAGPVGLLLRPVGSALGEIPTGAVISEIGSAVYQILAVLDRFLLFFWRGE